MKYIHPAGSHASVPFTPKLWVKRLEGEFWFLPTSKYDLKGPDQADWNKLCGISFNPLKPNENAIIIAWRYNIKQNVFEVAPYFNINNEIIVFDNKPSLILRCIQFERIHFNLNYSEFQLKFADDRTWKMDLRLSDRMTKRFWSSFRIQPWFGGNNPSPIQTELIINFK